VRPSCRPAKQYDELAPFQLTELHRLTLATECTAA
jgi:hypothetical protein